MTLRNLSVRERLIAEGVLVPKEDVVPRELESTEPVLRLDGAGAREARRAVARGGVVSMRELNWRDFVR